MATTTSTPLMSWEAFERLPDGDGFHRELIEGELQTLPPPKSRHSLIAANCYEVLRELKMKGIGRLFLEAGYKLSQDPVTWIQPDASFILAGRHLPADDEYFLGSPDLAVEIVSPSESASDLQRKVALLLNNGGRAVWVIYPATRMVEVHLADGTFFKRKMGDTLDAPYLLADWRFSISKLFED